MGEGGAPSELTIYPDYSSSTVYIWIKRKVSIKTREPEGMGVGPIRDPGVSGRARWGRALRS